MAISGPASQALLLVLTAVTLGGCAIGVERPANNETIALPTATKVVITGNASYTGLRVTVDGNDVTSQIRSTGPRRDEGDLVLAAGPHTLTASADVRCWYCSGGTTRSTATNTFTVLPAAPPRPIALSVVTANTTNSFDMGSVPWPQKIDRFAAFIIASGPLPDIISMTESSGWTWCSSPTWQSTGDYQLADRLIGTLRRSRGVTYRVAYMVGAEGSFGGGRCRYYSGDTVLYNPNRLSNITPADVAGRPQIAHNATDLGLQVRRSLPVCDLHYTSFEPIEQLIDGPSQTDKCNRPTPSAPAWLLLRKDASGGDYPVASMARFSVIGVPGSSFDVVTIHLPYGEEEQHRTPIDDLIRTLTEPPYRTTNPYYPLVVLGDFNQLARTNWPSGTTQVFSPTDDVMAVALGGSGGRFPPARSLTVNATMTLPNETPCRPQGEGDDFFPDRSFSDHCALLVRFTE